MCDKHDFMFDVDRAYEDQLVSALEASPQHSVREPESPRAPGVYLLYRDGLPVYVGKAKSLRNRIRDHLRKIDGRDGIEVDQVTCRFLTISRLWEVARAEEVLISRFSPEWNGIAGFSMHAPGQGRPACQAMSTSGTGCFHLRANWCDVTRPLRRRA